MPTRSVLLFCVLSLSLPGLTSVCAQEVTPVIVISPGVEVRNRDGDRVPAGLGEVLNTTVQKDGWRWVPSHRGWVAAKATLPLPEAVRTFSAAIQARPTAEAWHHRGLAYAALGEYRKAIADFDQAIAMDPKSAALRVNRGNAYRDSGELDKALRDYNAALERDPRNVIALNNRGLIFSAKGDYDQAMLDFSAAIRIRPDFAEALNHRGVVSWKQGKVDEAERDYKAAIELKRGLAEPYLNLGAVAASRGDYKTAVSHYRQALQLNPKFTAAHNDLAWILATAPDESVRDPQSAVAYAQKACELSQFKNPNALDTLAAALAAAGRYDEAVRRVDQALALAEDDQQAELTARKQLYAARQPFIDRK